MVSRRHFLKQTGTAALVAAVLPALRSLPVPSAVPTLEQQAAQLASELRGMGVHFLTVEGPGVDGALNLARRDRRLTMLPEHLWATEDGNELLRLAIAQHRQPLEQWPRYQA